VTEPELVTVTEYQRVEVPPVLLVPCPVAELPRKGVTWEDLAPYIAAKHQQQLECNKRFDCIRAWQNGNPNDCGVDK